MRCALYRMRAAHAPGPMHACMQELDEALYDEVKLKYEDEQASRRTHEDERARKWEMLTAVARQKANGR